MCMCMWLQPVGHAIAACHNAVAACHTCGCSLWHLRLQAGSLAYLSRMAEEEALGAELATWLGEGVGAEMVSNPDPNPKPTPQPNPNRNPNQVANRSLLLGPRGEVPPYYQHLHSTCCTC